MMDNLQIRQVLRNQEAIMEALTSMLHHTTPMTQLQLNLRKRLASCTGGTRAELERLKS